MRKSLLFAVALLLSLSGYVYADSFFVHITVDENGNGVFTNPYGSQALPGTLQNDPGPGGLDNVLTYDLGRPAGFAAGDVLITEDGVLDDVVRFNYSVFHSTLLFYSNPADGGFDSLADTSGPPAAFYPNTITLPEINGEVVYTPTPVNLAPYRIWKAA